MAPTTRQTTRESDNTDELATTTTAAADTAEPEMQSENAGSSTENPTTAARNSAADENSTAAAATATTEEVMDSLAMPHRNAILTDDYEVSIQGASNDSRWKMTESQLLSEGSTHYHGWNKLACIFLKSAGLIGLIDGTEPRPSGARLTPDTLARWNTRDAVATAQLSSYVSLGLLTVVDTSSAASMWQSIESQFQFTGAGAVILANRKLTSKFIGPNESMEDHILSLRRLRSALLSAGGTLTNDQWKIIIIQSLQHKWAQFKPTAIIIDKPDKIFEFLLLEERSMDFSAPSTDETALVTRTNPPNPPRRRYDGPPCSNCKRRGHSESRCYAPGGRLAHQAPSWYVPPNSGGPRQQANATTETKSITYSESARMAADSEHHFSGAILDSGATSHMTNSIANLSDYVTLDSPTQIGLAKSGSFLECLGRGTMTVKFILNGKIRTHALTDVLYVPQLETDLISVSKLEDAGIQLHFRTSKCFLALNGVEFGYAERFGGLYRLRASYSPPIYGYLASAQQDSRQDIDTWHRRFGHASEARIKSMVKHSAITGIELLDRKIAGSCEACILSKQTAVPSPPRSSRATTLFSVIHSDILFFSEPSMGGAKYGLEFIDEASGFTWVYALNDKSADTILSHFVALDASVEAQFGKRIQALHSDNGGEYVNHAMSAYLASRGIQQRTTAPHRHEMNGIAERMNRTAAECVRAILIDARLPHGYWAEAYYYWCYVHNRTSLSFLEDDVTPFERVYGTKPDVSHLRTFGSKVYVKVPDANRKKLDPKSEIGIFVGYYEDAAYRIMRPDHSIVKSKDVIFIELRGVRTLTDTDDLDDANVNPPPLSASSDTTTSAPASDIPTPTELRRSQRSDHTTERRRLGIEQETSLRHLDTANAAHSRKTVAGITIPKSFKEAMASEQSAEWLQAASYELGKLTQHDVWDETEAPEGAHIISGMWVFNIKEEPDGSLLYRMRWVARGDSQLENEFGELHATSGDFTVARIVCALSAVENSTLSAHDISSAYLHSPLELEDPIYVVYPTGFHPRKPGSVCKLKKALYGLRQGARAWQDEFQRTMSSCGFHQLQTAPSAFRRSDSQGETIVGTHVDDLTCVSSAQDELSRFTTDIGKHYQYTSKDLSKPAKILGWTISTSNAYISLSVDSKIRSMAERYGLNEAKPCSTPMAMDSLKRFSEDTDEPFSEPPFPYRQAVGELMWIATNARPDIAYSAHVLARFVQSPKWIHWNAVKRVIRYLRTTQDVSIHYSKSAQTEITKGYCDADWGRDPTDRRSVSGYVFTVGGGAISWKVKR